MRTVDEINKDIQNVDTNQISDGYHTFAELYEHRICLFMALCNVLSRQDDNLQVNDKAKVWRSLRHSDGELAFGGTWFVLGIWQFEGWQITYHLPIEKWDECSFAAELNQAPEFDGHTSEDVLYRLSEL